MTRASCQRLRRRATLAGPLERLFELSQGPDHDIARPPLPVLAPLLSLFAAALLATAAGAAPVTGARIIAADQEPQNWLSHGRTYGEQRYSPLRQVNDANVEQLGLAWSYATHTTRGLQATPLVVDGRMYATGVWSVVYALDAKTGKELWTYDPEVPRAWGRYACCDAVNRGVALWADALYFATLDGRLISLDARTGKKRWEVNTIDRTKPYTITGAPRVVKGKVLIGNGGGEYGVRGYFSAYDAATGKLAWRFYTVPGDPEARVRASGTRAGREDLDRRVVGRRRRRHRVGLDGLRPGPRHAVRRHGQRLALGALDPFSGRRRQPVPLVDPRARSRQRPAQVALPGHAGGQLGLHGDPAHHPCGPGDRRQAAQGADAGAEERLLLRHRPRHRRTALRRQVHSGDLGEPRRPEDRVAPSRRPTATGARRRSSSSRRRSAATTGIRWRSIRRPGSSTSPRCSRSASTRRRQEYLKTGKYTRREMFWNPGVDWNEYTNTIYALLQQTGGSLPPDRGYLKAWDPVAKKTRWEIEYPAFWNGGLLTTAGNLLFQGTGDGRFVAYAADTGKTLWSVPTMIGIIAPPMTYSVDGEQYVAVLAGYGGGGAVTGGDPRTMASGKYLNEGHILAFKLGGKAPAAEG